ncbi:glucose PTS transporter subunit IIA [Aliiglaciecola sp. CAU 1673]|uniref:PTS sugar transporter subunit IIA n=1 Tax=Aliiglaciecola sp. CAU 1673 TaxID=3032595 RepID=UPI0023DCC47E|nr:glucose PTS transporter subunit IIA [Aliiglaciecola sp. CAU 1673]MDF2177740.1 glucose PTS transporter subunit IIA [Aliiglaciecola sp. CAU 1673]
MAKAAAAQSAPEKPVATAKRCIRLPVPCPISGTVMALEDVPVAIFRHGLMGKGVAIDPSGYRMLAPFDGQVRAISSANEQWRIRSTQGLELTIQLGMEAHRLMGEGFKLKVKVGHQFKKGDTLLEFDPRLLKERATSALCFVVTTQTAKLSQVEAHCHAMLAGDEPCMTLHFG